MTRVLRNARRLVRTLAAEGWGVISDFLRLLLYVVGAAVILGVAWAVVSLVLGLPISGRL